MVSRKPLIEPPQEPHFMSDETRGLAKTVVYGLLALLVPRTDMQRPEPLENLTDEPSPYDLTAQSDQDSPKAEEARDEIKRQEMRLDSGDINKTEYFAEVAGILIRTEEFQRLMEHLGAHAMEAAIKEVIENRQEQEAPVWVWSIRKR